jgi:hypothetical protein
MVAATLKIKLKTEKQKKNVTKKYDWKKFVKDKNLQQKYQIEIKNGFEILSHMPEEESSNETKVQDDFNRLQQIREERNKQKDIDKNQLYKYSMDE